MNSDDSMIDLLIRHELAMAGMYSACKQAYPEAADFWGQLVIEEKAHASVLKALEKELESENVYLNERKFNPAGLHTALDYTTRQIQSVVAGEHTLVQALVIALDIERAIIEKDFFEVFETDSASMKQEFAELKQHTMDHANRIAELIQQIRASQA